MTKRQQKESARIGIPKVTRPVKQQNVGRFLTQEQIVSLEEKHHDKVRFSFIYFNRSHDLFNCGNTKDGWYIVLLDNLKEVSELSKNEFLFDQRYKNHYDSHQHDWDKVEHHYPLPEEMFEQVKDECWQFRLTSSQGRVHGFMVKNVFYIIWLDPHHNFYPDERFGGEKYYDKPLTPYQEKEIELEDLKTKCANLEADNEMLLNQLIELEEKLLKYEKAI